MTSKDLPNGFNPARSFESVQEAIDYIHSEPSRWPDTDALAWAIIKTNVAADEAGFASEVLYEYFSAMPE